MLWGTARRPRSGASGDDNLRVQFSFKYYGFSCHRLLQLGSVKARERTAFMTATARRCPVAGTCAKGSAFSRPGGRGGSPLPPRAAFRRAAWPAPAVTAGLRAVQGLNDGEERRLHPRRSPRCRPTTSASPWRRPQGKAYDRGRYDRADLLDPVDLEGLLPWRRGRSSSRANRSRRGLGRRGRDRPGVQLDRRGGAVQGQGDEPPGEPGRRSPQLARSRASAPTRCRAKIIGIHSRLRRPPARGEPGSLWSNPTPTKAQPGDLHADVGLRALPDDPAVAVDLYTRPCSINGQRQGPRGPWPRRWPTAARTC